MKKALFLSLIAAAAFCACKPSEPVTVLSGNFPGKQTVSIKIDSTQVDTVITLQDGAFQVDLPCVVEFPASISAEGCDTVQFLADGTTLTAALDQNGKIQVTSETPETSEQTAYVNFCKWEEAIQAKLNAIESEEQWTAAVAEIKDSCYAAAKAHPSSYIAYNAVVDAYRTQAFEDDIFDEIFAVMTHAYDGIQPIQSCKQTLRDRKATAEGMQFSDIVVDQDPEHRAQNIARLSDYVGKGKYVVVDFWASWCGPCRRAIPTIKTIYDKYKGDDFDVVSIAVNDEIAATKKAAKELGITWHQIINAGHLATDVYGFEFIPYLILFGPDGTILKRNIQIDDLEAEVAKALGR